MARVQLVPPPEPVDDFDPFDRPPTLAEAAKAVAAALAYWALIAAFFGLTP